jgi:hypothetical protein
VLDEDFPELATFEGGEHRIRDNPPLICHLQDEEEAVIEKLACARRLSVTALRWRKTSGYCWIAMNSRISP